MFTDTEKIDLRRYMGYETFGIGPAGMQSHRFMHVYGMLEYRMNNISAGEETVVRGYLSRLGSLESDLFAMRSNVGTAAAAVWTRNPDEVRERKQLYADERRRLCAFFGIPPGAGVGNTTSVPMVV